MRYNALISMRYNALKSMRFIDVARAREKKNFFAIFEIFELFWPILAKKVIERPGNFF